MYKNQLQELAQRSCFNLPSYSCIREGPDHAPRFRAKVNFNAEVFESPSFCSTLRQAEHAAAEVALKILSVRGPSRTLAARVLDETGVYKNLLQETTHRAGLKLPAYTIVRSGLGHVPVFSCTVELGGMSFIGEPTRTKKQAQKSAAMTAWFSLKNLSQSGSSSCSLSELGGKDEQEQVTIARYLASLQSAETDKFLRRDHLNDRMELAPLRGEMISYEAGGSFYPMPCQSFTYSHFSPGLAMHQVKPQARVSEQQSHLLALPYAPTSVPRPPFFPFIRSIIRPDHGSYLLARGQETIPIVPGIRPIFYFTGPVPVQVRSISQVTIKEIDDNTELEEWLSNSASSSGWKCDLQSSVSGISPTPVLNCADSLCAHSRSRIQELLQGKDENNSESAPNSRTFSRQNPYGPSFVYSNVRPRNPPLGSSPRLARGFTPPLSAPPVKVGKARAISLGSTRAEAPNYLVSAQTPTRTGISVASIRPWLEGAKNIRGMPCTSSMAPAVQIRTVVPVCSAPPIRSKEETVSVGGRKTV